MVLNEILVLADNEAAEPGCSAEHGLSLGLRMADGGTWLFDTGQSPNFLANAARLGFDPVGVRGCLLSHGHWDHTGGVQALAAAGFQGRFYGHPDTFAERFSLSNPANPRSIGLSSGAAAVVRERFEDVVGLRQLAPGLWMLTEIGRKPGQAQAVKDFYLDLDARRPDPVADDACLVADTPSGRAVIMGCCHSGIANTLDAVEEALGPAPIAWLIGGLHLSNAGAEAWSEAAIILDRHRVERVRAGHCTGLAATAAMAERMSGSVAGLGSGLRLVL